MKSVSSEVKEYLFDRLMSIYGGSNAIF